MASAPVPPAAYNEPVKAYAPGSPERASLRRTIERMAGERVEIASVVAGQELRTGNLSPAVMPHLHSHVLGDVHLAGPAEVRQAIGAALEARREWAATPWPDRAGVFLRAADLLTGPWRDVLNAATMLGQSKTVHQAEIDAVCELADFLRFNVEYMARIYAEQPMSPPGVWNRMEYRPLEGFVFAVSPFNFTSIAGNLPTSAALMGNTVVWKGAETAALSSHYFMKLLQEAGLPDGVINLVHGPGSVVGETVLDHPELAGIHFTGSTEVFRWMWKRVGENLERYRVYPRLVGETGGKDFIVAHPSADVEELVTAVVRGGFEYQGQKCSAPSRVFVPAPMWREVSGRIAEEVSTIRMGDVRDFGNFMGAVIEQSALDRHRQAIDDARAHADTDILVGGEVDDSEGYFVAPTVVVTRDPDFRLLKEELFGPIVTTYVYEEKRWGDTLELIDRATPYALTGAVFARDRAAIQEAESALVNAAGNFYINDKPTGAVVGQQPFGGARASGTNDKAGSMWNLIRWASPRAVKETLVPPRDYRYPWLKSD
ncbi:MAG: L-glutamate gamma-semialdehyde dehydrogenase [Chloroflexi bacterium]|nr:MAG: L-glutamate gamma-semialdehyde dehydrogenase [Chloroflexota bacterium]